MGIKADSVPALRTHGFIERDLNAVGLVPVIGSAEGVGGGLPGGGGA